LQGASRSWEFGYRDELARYSAEVPWLKYAATVSRPWEDAEWTGERGRVDDVLRKYTDAWGLRPQETTAYLCGHPHMVENTRSILHRAGWQKDAVLEEVYFPASKETQTA
jgi:NAD(P)H-flavin reductase